MVRGMVTNINYGRGCGFIQPDGDEAAREVYFEREDVREIPFAELHFGEMVEYELLTEQPSPSQLRAARVSPTAG